MIRLRPTFTAAILVAALVLTVGLAGSKIGQAAAPLSGQEKEGKSPDKVTEAVDRTVKLIEQRPIEGVDDQERLAIYAMDVVSGKVTPIADEPGPGLTYCGSPYWSYDGRKILFDASPGRNFRETRLMVFDASESGVRLRDLGAGNCPTISPDGKRIAFWLNPGAVPGAQWGMWIMDADGINRRRLTGVGGFNRWSPDGRHILVGSFGSPYRVTLVDVQTGAERPVRIAGHEFTTVPSWAGEGQEIVAAVRSASGVGIVLIDVTDPEQAQIKQVLWRRGDRLKVWVTYPVYSAKTGRCVFIGKDEQGPALYMVKAGEFDPPKRLEADGYEKYIATLAFSPDGRYVLFCSGSLQP